MIICTTSVRLQCGNGTLQLKGNSHENLSDSMHLLRDYSIKPLISTHHHMKNNRERNKSCLKGLSHEN